MAASCAPFTVPSILKFSFLSEHEERTTRRIKRGTNLINAAHLIIVQIYIFPFTFHSGRRGFNLNCAASPFRREFIPGLPDMPDGRRRDRYFHRMQNKLKAITVNSLRQDEGLPRKIFPNIIFFFNYLITCVL